MDVVKKNPVEAVSFFVGIIVLVMGMILSATEGVAQIFGNILNFVGTLLSAVAGTWVYGEAAARKAFAAQISLVRGQLATACAQINQALDLADEDEAERQIALVKIGQAMSTLTNAMKDISNMTESEISVDSERLILAKRAIQDLGEKLDFADEAGIPEVKSSSVDEIKGDISVALGAINEALNAASQGGAFAAGRRHGSRAEYAGDDLTEIERVLRAMVGRIAGSKAYAQRLTVDGIPLSEFRSLCAQSCPKLSIKRFGFMKFTDFARFICHGSAIVLDKGRAEQPVLVFSDRAIVPLANVGRDYVHSIDNYRQILWTAPLIARVSSMEDFETVCDAVNRTGELTCTPELVDLACERGIATRRDAYKFIVFSLISCGALKQVQGASASTPQSLVKVHDSLDAALTISRLRRLTADKIKGITGSIDDETFSKAFFYGA